MNESDQLTDCVKTGGVTAAFDTPAGIALNGDFLYVTSAAEVKVCDVNGLVVTNCRVAAGGFTPAHALLLA